MADIKSLASIREKWQRVTPGRVQDYTDGVTSPKVDWASAARAAEAAFEAGIQQAIAAKRFGKGVQSAGTAKWQANTIEKGTTRWPQGVQIGGSAFERGFSPFREVIERTQLPPRGPKGDPRNIERVAVIARALRAQKIKG